MVTLSNLDKVLYPAASFTKAHVIEYYVHVAEWILPHLYNRPVTLNRFPDGVGGQAFYEKDAPRFTPDWVAIAPVPRRAGGAPIRYVLINDRATLVWCANIASLELHPFLHRAEALDRPTSLVFDLDPGPGATVVDCASVAFLLRQFFENAGMKSFPKMSGSKGIQLYVPLNTAVTYEQTQKLAHALATSLAQQHPDRIVAEMAKNLRTGRVFIDWSQNSDFKTTVGVYSLRAKTGKPFVSLPVTWEELDSISSGKEKNRFCLDPDAALKRIEKIGDLFAPVLTLRQSLPESVQASPKVRRFVIQKHAARQLHYDFRLEMNGVLRSWAVPKGVPYVLDERRLAMLTEDHPIEYIDFEGTIPEGQYGGGTVMVWDEGTYEVIDGNYFKGKLRIALRGKKLNGEWLLVSARDPEKKRWFLSKVDEPATSPSEELSARTGRTMQQIASGSDAQWHSNRTDVPGLDLDTLPKAQIEFIEPMQAQASPVLPEGAGWQYEIKLDGYRALALRDKGIVQLLSRRNNNLNSRFPTIAEALQQLEDGLIIDGEIVALDEKGRPLFHVLQNHKTSKRPIVYYAFDILIYRGRSTMGLPLAKRREILSSALAGGREPIRISVPLDAQPADLIAAVAEQGLEGLVAKRAESLYEAGRRTGAWAKYKIDKGQELVIGGYKPGKDGFDNLAVGYYEDGKLLFIAKLKNGFVAETKAHIAEQFSSLETGECPFDNLPEPRGARRGEALTAEAMRKYRWLKPELVVQAAFTEWTDANHLRHSRFIGLRDDKDPREVVRES